MGLAMEIVAATATAAAAAGSAMTAAADNSLTIRPAREGTMVWLIAAWADVQTAGFWRIVSPKMHDAVQGIRMDTVVSDPTPMYPHGLKQRLYPNDILALTISGAAVVGDIETACMLIHYADLGGTEAKLLTYEQVMQRAVNVMGVENTIATIATGGWGGAEAINAEFDQGKALTDYALVGYTVDTECAAVRWRGSDIGNLGVGGPGIETERHVTNDWFLRLSRLTGLATIPVFNFSNRGGILIDAAQDENGADTTVISFFAELGPGGPAGAR